MSNSAPNLYKTVDSAHSLDEVIGGRGQLEGNFLSGLGRRVRTRVADDREAGPAFDLGAGI
jgi:hypothetical protein